MARGDLLADAADVVVLCRESIGRGCVCLLAASPCVHLSTDPDLSESHFREFLWRSAVRAVCGWATLRMSFVARLDSCRCPPQRTHTPTLTVNSGAQLTAARVSTSLFPKLELTVGTHRWRRLAGRLRAGPGVQCQCAHTCVALARLVAREQAGVAIGSFANTT
jgi:hypothetical protein